MSKWLAGAVLICSLCPAAAETGFVLTEAEWSRPRSAQVVKGLPSVQGAISLWLQDTQANSLELRYPGGAAGSLWAQELKDWLIALGVPGGKVLISPGQPRDFELTIAVLP